VLVHSMYCLIKPSAWQSDALLKLIIGKGWLKPQYTLHWHVTKDISAQRNLCWAHARIGMHLKHTSSASIRE
jgi:hypothetical protein